MFGWLRRKRSDPHAALRQRNEELTEEWYLREENRKIENEISKMGPLRAAAFEDDAELTSERVAPFAERGIIEGYQRNPYVRGTIDSVVGELASVCYKFFIVRPNGEEEEIIPKTAIWNRKEMNIATMFRMAANPQQSAQVVMEEFWTNRFVSGVGVLEFMTNGTPFSGIKGIVAVPTRKLEVQFKNGLPFRYTIGTSYSTKSTDERIVEVDQVTGRSKAFILAAYNPLQPKNVVSVLDTVRDPIRALNEHNRSKVSGLSGGLSGAGVFHQMNRTGDNRENMSDEQARKLSYQIARRMTGSVNRSRPLVTKHELGYIDLSHTNAHYANEDLQRLLSLQIPMAYGIPPQVLSFDSSANAYSNFQNAHRKFYEGFIGPHASRFANELSRFLSSWYQEDIIIRVDESSVPIMRELRQEELIRAASVVGRFFSLDEVRTMFGLCKTEKIAEEEDRNSVIMAWEAGSGVPPPMEDGEQVPGGGGPGAPPGGGSGTGKDEKKPSAADAVAKKKEEEKKKKEEEEKEKKTAKKQKPQKKTVEEK